MAEKKRTPVWVWAATAVVLVTCGAITVQNYFRTTNRAEALNTVKMVGLAYHQFQETNNRPPRSFDELAKFAQTKSINLPPGAADVTVIWGAGIGSLNKDGPGGEVVLGYLPASGKKDVFVLYADGSVKQEPEATFFRAKFAIPLPAQ